MIVVHEYVDDGGYSPFSKWFDSLDAQAAAKVTTSLLRIEMGNISNVKSVGKGVYEYKINYGPGYRIYFGKEGDQLVILLGGGTKQRQSKDINKAYNLWNGYLERKRESE